MQEFPAPPIDAQISYRAYQALDRRLYETEAQLRQAAIELKQQQPALYPKGERRESNIDP